jgi:hypothetical protein
MTKWDLQSHFRNRKRLHAKDTGNGTAWQTHVHRGYGELGATAEHDPRRLLRIGNRLNPGRARR